MCKGVGAVNGLDRIAATRAPIPVEWGRCWLTLPRPMGEGLSRRAFTDHHAERGWLWVHSCKVAGGHVGPAMMNVMADRPDAVA